MNESIACSRCGRKDEMNGAFLPDGWEGSALEAVCAGCQYAEWHPHCTSVRVEAGYGDRLDVEALERGEAVTVNIDETPVVIRSVEDLSGLGTGEIGWCDYIDLGISWIDDADFPSSWTCPECGGTTFEGVHRDYMASNLKGASFSPEVAE